LRIIILGAGAIGGGLFEQGYDMLLVARGAHYEALVSHGLSVDTPDETRRLPVPTVSDPKDITFGANDVVLLAEKSQDTQRAVETLAAVAPPRCWCSARRTVWRTSGPCSGTSPPSTACA
jgi:2-dehydropantoate 2-reductase